VYDNVWEIAQSIVGSNQKINGEVAVTEQELNQGRVLGVMISTFIGPALVVADLWASTWTIFRILQLYIGRHVDVGVD